MKTKNDPRALFDALPDESKFATVNGLSQAVSRLRNLAEGLEERLPPDYTPEQILEAVRVALALSQAALADIDPDSSGSTPDIITAGAFRYCQKLQANRRK